MFRWWQKNKLPPTNKYGTLGINGVLEITTKNGLQKRKGDSKNPVVDENGKIIYAPSAEEYITKLRHSKKGIRWFDTKNSNQSSPIPYDEDALDYISSFYENVKRQPDKYQTLGTGLDV